MSTEAIEPQIAHELATPDQPVFFPVSLTKLLLLSICTLGIYEIYWFYQNWNFVKRREKSDITPAARSIFAYFFCYSLFQKISDQSSITTGKSILAGPLAAGWIVTTLLWKLPDPYWLISYSAILFLLPVQHTVNSLNAHVAPEHKKNDRFSAWNIAGLVIGGLFFILVLIGTFFPPEQA